MSIIDETRKLVENRRHGVADTSVDKEDKKEEERRDSIKDLSLSTIWDILDGESVALTGGSRDDGFAIKPEVLVYKTRVYDENIWVKSKPSYNLHRYNYIVAISRLVLSKSRYGNYSDYLKLFMGDNKRDLLEAGFKTRSLLTAPNGEHYVELNVDSGWLKDVSQSLRFLSLDLVESSPVDSAGIHVDIDEKITKSIDRYYSFFSKIGIGRNDEWCRYLASR